MIKIETNIYKNKRWEKSKIDFSQNNNKKNNNIDSKAKSKSNNENSKIVTIEVFPNKEKQTWIGMGGAITEASSYNMDKLEKDEKEAFINAYYSKEGLNYNLGRVSIASNDFCLKKYQLTKKKDLRDFSIDHDRQSIIPNIKEIQKKKILEFVASPWSPPRFMKTTRLLIFGGHLRKKYYDLYSEYLTRFIRKYAEEGINIKYLTIQNEPEARQIWESCVFSLDQQKDLIYNYMIPKMKKYKLDTKLLVWDHNKERLSEVANFLIQKNPYIAGIGYHYYTGPHPEQVKKTREDFKDIMMIHTEGCCGFSPYNENKWINDAEIYLDDIVKDINNGGNGYIDWNIFLDYKGGPTDKRNFCKSPIILDEDNHFKLTPIYYYLGHISKYFEPGSIIIKNDSKDNNLLVATCKNKNKTITTICNNTNEDCEINLKLEEKKIDDTIKSHSIITYII